MKVLICDKHKMDSFNLPSEIEDFYIINYVGYDENDTLINESINLVAKNNKWVLETDESLNVLLDNNIIDEAVLNIYTSYTLKFSDLNSSVNIQIVPDFEKYIYLDTSRLNNIIIGPNNDCNIKYQTKYKLPNNARIALENNLYVIYDLSNDDNYVYVNNKKYDNAVLRLGDVIYVGIIKIIWMDKYIMVNNPNNKLEFIDLAPYNNNIVVDNNNISVVTESEKNLKLYKENQLFFHTPRLINEIIPEEIKFETPPDQIRDDSMPAILTIGSSVVFGLTAGVTALYAIRGLSTGTLDKFSAYIELSMSAMMLVACIVFPVLTEVWQRNNIKKKERIRQERYKEYLNKKVESINKIIDKQQRILYDNNLELKEILNRILSNNGIWAREISDNDFLTVRLGLGDINAKINIEIPTEEFSLYDDNLKEDVIRIASEKRILKNVPTTISLVENKVTPIIINTNFKDSFIDSIMLQLLYYYSGADLKIVTFTTELNENKWDYLKYMPHSFDVNRENRYFGSTDAEIQKISMILEHEYDKRLEKLSNSNNEELAKLESYNKYLNFSEYYLIITDNFKHVKNSSIINKILNSDSNIGFSILIIESSIKNLPSKLDKFISIENNESGIFDRNIEAGNQIKFSAEYLNGLNISNYTNLLANIPIGSKAVSTAIPESINFLDLFHVGRVDQLNVVTKWKENNPTTSLNTIIGLKENEQPIGLDLHEKFHGPHGLIAGSTGSGKSEFIITYILSMAINYSPEEVQFILIDYKGGGLAGAFENKETKIKIPHLIGTITNLDKNDMNRTLVSIRSELQRRQVVFNEVRDALGESTIDIYKYQRLYREGKVKSNISHLFVIADEFAELKDQQPEFMDELISTARIGRSLGVHLILATQKPSGVVNDQIWSNSRFKVCLKVQTAEDSMEMLKKDDASTIKQTGRFYLQVGNDELFELGQSAWSGAKYTPVDRYLKKIDDNLVFISNDGSVIKSVNNEAKIIDTENLGDQLTNIVKYLYNVGIREKLPFQSLWLPSIPDEVYLTNLIKKYSFKSNFFNFNIPVGEYDKPKKQLQGLYNLNINCNNTLLLGAPGVGKENFITTLIYSACISHTPKEIEFYIMDFGSEVLTMFNKMPHVGDVITPDSIKKVDAQFAMLSREIKKRKYLFADYSGSFESYCKNSGKTVPLIVTVINSFESFMENLDGDDYLIHLLREGSKFGIVFLISATSSNSIRTTIMDNFSNKILLQLADEFDYQYMLGYDRGLAPKKVFGRGIAIIEEEPCEFQTAYIDLKDNINNIIKNNSKILMDNYKYKAPEVKILPNIITLDYLLKLNKSILLNAVPLGYSDEDLSLFTYNFVKNKLSLITGNTMLTDLTFMCGIIDLLDSIKNISLNIFDFSDLVSTDGNANYFNSNFSVPFKEILSNNNQTISVYLMIGVSNITAVLNENELKEFNIIMKNIQKLNNFYFVIFDNYEDIKTSKEESWLQNVNGIWSGEGIDRQEIFTINNLSNFDTEDEPDDRIYVIDNSNCVSVKSIGKEDI